MRSILSQPAERFLYMLLFVAGVFYVFNSWSPSSYGFFLKQVDAQQSGIIWGEPRPIRSDEWAVVTPLTQATVNNGFERYNKTSFYNEDLRINYGLPIFDWGMVFKPTMWGYLFLSPAKAYSLQWYLTFVLFVVGYFKLFKKIGIRVDLSIILSFSLFFTGATQFWWDEKGPVYAFFPLVIYSLISNGNIYHKLFFYYWLGVAWLITDFYPPLIISLAFVGALVFILNINQWWSLKKAAMLVIGSLAIVVTALFYLKDYLINTSKTVYPGHRSFSGGGVNWQEWISQLFPFSSFNSHFETLYNINISEVGTVGFAYILMLLVHLDFSELKKYEFNNKTFKPLILLTSGLVLLNLWMIAPIPEWFGKILLWNNVHPNRMVYASGVLLGMTSLLFLQDCKYVISIKRAAIYFAIIVFAWWVLKFSPMVSDPKGLNGFNHNYTDFYLILAVLISYLLIYLLRVSVVNSFALTSLLASVVVFFGFNPIQSSEAIFSPHTNIKKLLDNSVDEKTGVLAVSGYPGAILNGLGYKSVTHVTAVPDLQLWRHMFPDMPEDEFSRTFNRYSHIHLNDVASPVSTAPDVVEIPMSLFKKVEYYPPLKKIDKKVLNLNNEVQAKGVIKAGLGGELNTLSPLIGTYNGKSDGKLSLTVCVSDRCENSTVNLNGKGDNQYLKIKLADSLKVDAGQNIDYTLSLGDSSNPVALWAVNEFGETSVTLMGKTDRRKMSVIFELGYENE